MRAVTRDFDYGSPTVPEGALFVAADEPLLIFPCARAAEAHLEAIDVADGVYPAAYGPNGEHYRIRTSGQQVVIERSGEPDRPDELKALLLRYLQAVARAPSDMESLAELSNQAWRIEHDHYGNRFRSRMPWWGWMSIMAGVAAILYLLFR
ncbi:MAG TPA: hypothetical protein VGW34_02290 [Allosphingosinicella sp.]|nr:hypothetical protein [Allosphingosinicella sp.]